MSTSPRKGEALQLTAKSLRANAVLHPAKLTGLTVPVQRLAPATQQYSPVPGWGAKRY
jgi:hypothetical protein